MVLRRVAPLVALLVTVSVILAGCGSSDSSRSDSQAAKPHVIAAFYPLQFLATEIGSTDVTVANLTASGGEPHDLELSPSQVAEISFADLLIYLKGFQPAVDEAFEQNPPKAVLDVSTIVPPAKHGEADSEHSGDPHIWLDPTTFAKLATAISEKLADLDSPSAEAYRSRAQSLVTRLENLDREYQSGLRTCQRRTIVTSHAAFGYLTERYNLEQIGISGISPDVEPSPARVAEVQRMIEDNGVTTIFFETLASPKTAQTLARDLGVKTAVLDPVEGLTDNAEADYFSMMRANLTELRKALACR